MVNHCKLVAHAPPLDCEKRASHSRSISVLAWVCNLSAVCHVSEWCGVCDLLVVLCVVILCVCDVASTSRAIIYFDELIITAI